MILARRSLADATILDLFAGTGALGCEALSRGASSAVFVDNFRDAIALVRENLTRINAPPQTIVKRDFLNAIPNLRGPFDLIFLDPPYAEHLVSPILHKLADNAQLLREETIVCAEHGADEPPFTGDAFAQISHRTYGDTSLSLWIPNLKETSA